MTSVNELNAYQRGMKEGMRVGEQKQNNDVINLLKMEHNYYLKSNHLAKAKLLQKIINNFS